MPKSGQERLEKYNVKFDPDVVRSRFAATKEIAASKQATHQVALAEKAAAVNAIMAENGISPMQAMIYQGFNNAIYSLSLKFTGDVLTAEAHAVCAKYYVRLGKITVGTYKVPLFNVEVANAILSLYNIPPWTPPVGL